jgi:copper(I)-binding protein
MRRAIIAATLFLAACQQPEAPKVEAHDAWARAVATPGGMAAAYLKISNQGGEDRLVSVHSDRGSGASIHLSRMANGVMEMRAMPEGLPVPARGEVSLAPGGTHVMLDGAGPLVAGERFNLVLQFEKSGDVTVPVSVVAPGAR